MIKRVIMRTFSLIGCLLLLGSFQNSSAQNTDNDICIPSVLYMLSDTRNDIFIEPLIKRWKPYDDFVRFSGNASYSRRLMRVASVDSPRNNDTIITSLVNGDGFETRKTITSVIKVGKKFTGEKPVTMQIMGDSYVNGAFFKDALLTKGYVPNLKLVGLRKIKGENGQYDEGHGGWKLNDYFNVPVSEITSYHGYMQPEGDYRYWGATGFWINCHKVMKGQLTDFSSVYHCGRYDDYAVSFNEETGYLLSPQKNDMQFDNQLGTFVVYNGKKWMQVKDSDLTWGIDLHKYFTMWKLGFPDFFAVLLGLNDFRYDIHSDFTQWNKQIEIMKNNYLNIVPNGKFVILIPASTCGSMDNEKGDFTLYQNAAMWRFRKNLIDTFDNRTEEGYYLVDTAIAIDNEDGYERSGQGIQKGNPHPYLSYPSMGIPLAAFIQIYR